MHVNMELEELFINSVTVIFETKHRLTIDSRQIGHEMMQRYCNRRLQLCIINNRMTNTIQCHVVHECQANSNSQGGHSNCMDGCSLTECQQHSAHLVNHKSRHN